MSDQTTTVAVAPQGAPGSFAPNPRMEEQLKNTTPELLAGDIAMRAVARMAGAQPAVPAGAGQHAQGAAPAGCPPQQATPVQPQAGVSPAAASPADPARPAAPSLEQRFAAPESVEQPVARVLPEVPPAQDIPEPQNLADNAHHAFAASRAQVKQFRDLAEQYRHETEAMRQKYDEYMKRENAIAEKLTAEQKRSHDLEEEVGKLDLSRSPSFRQKFDVPLQGKRDEIASILRDNGMSDQDAASLSEEIMVADASQVSGLVSNLPTIAQGMIMVRHNEASGLWSERAQALDDWRTTQSGLTEVSAREGAVVNAQRRAELANTAFERIKGVATMAWDDPEYVAQRNEAVEKAKAWYQNAPDDQIAAAAMEGALAPFAYRRVSELEQQVVQLQQQLEAAMRVRNPTVAPYFRSVPVVQPPPQKAPQQPLGTIPGQPWATPADAAVSASSIADGMVRGVLGLR